MNNKLELKNLPQNIKYLLSIFLVSMALGILTGLVYVYMTTNMNTVGITERFNGSEVIDNEIPVNYPKPIENMILTTHNHLVNFSFISLILALIFYFNTIVNGWIKTIVMVEPFIGTIIMFSSMWLMRYVDSNFSYLIIFSSIITYSMWFLMISISIYDLNKKDRNK
tara:strand:- start:2947 stop:3447 length:501 start_codon:yes stop_codon:yes gene_type:complete